MAPKCLKHGSEMMQREAYPFASHYCPLCEMEPCPSCAALRGEVAKDKEVINAQHAELNRLSKRVMEAEAALARYRGAVNIDRETVGRIMHESWTRTKRKQGWHHPSEPCTNPYIKCGSLSLPGNCGMQHADLVPWEQLPEMQKDINRHAFDDVLAELKRRAGEG